MVGKLEVQGYTIEPLDNPRQNPRRVFYRPRTGIPTLPLPADPYHTKLFLNSGFTLEPPLVVPAKREYKHTRKFLKKQAQKKNK